MSFNKYHGETSGNGRGNVFWSRANEDGAPFRGPASPMLKQEEFEELVERVYDTKSGTFDMSQPDMICGNRTFAAIIDRVGNNLFRVLDYQTRWHEPGGGTPVMHVFIIWSEPYQELPTKHYSQGGIPHGNHGSSHSVGPPPIIRG